MQAKIRRDIANPQAAVGRTVIGVGWDKLCPLTLPSPWGRRWGEGFGVLLVPTTECLQDGWRIVAGTEIQQVEQIAAKKGPIGFEFDRCAIGSQGFIEQALIFQSITQVVVGFGIVRFEVDRLLKLRHRFGQLMFFQKGIAQIVVRFGEARLETDGLLTLPHRFWQLT